MRFGWVALLVAGGLAACGGGSSSPDPDPDPDVPGVALTLHAEGFVQPVQITHAGDGSDRMFVIERRGLVHEIRDGAPAAGPYLDLRAIVRSVGGEQGLLSIAFPPDFSALRYFYVVYTDQSGALVLARVPLLADSDVPDSGALETLLTVPQPFANHNGGNAVFGPDGMLYLSVGDGGSANDPLGHGQNIGTLLGTLLRIDVEAVVAEGGETYVVPDDNPLRGVDGAREEIWAYGLRNPWRFSFDRLTGDLYIADVGQNAYEEINFQPASSAGGENYGWSVMEGAHCFRTASCDTAGLVPPVTEYPHAGGDCSVTGGSVYRGDEHPSLFGLYLYGDFCSGRIRGLRRSGDAWESIVLMEGGPPISAFGEDERGELYLADYSAGVVYRVGVP